MKPSNPKETVGIRKAPISTVPMNVVAELGVAMLDGATKYGRHNYRATGARASVYFDATMRHLIAWWEGEDYDPDSGLHHVIKAMSSLCVLRDSMKHNKFEDDRPPRTPSFYDGLHGAACEIIERNEELEPRHYTIADIDRVTNR